MKKRNQSVFAKEFPWRRLARVYRVNQTAIALLHADTRALLKSTVMDRKDKSEKIEKLEAQIDPQNTVAGRDCERRMRAEM